MNNRLLWYFLLALVFTLGSQFLRLLTERDSYQISIEQAGEVIRQSVPFISDLFSHSYRVTTSEGKDYVMKVTKFKLMRHVIRNEILGEDGGGDVPRQGIGLREAAGNPEDDAGKKNGGPET